MRIFLASANAKKIAEMQRILAQHVPDIEVLGQCVRDALDELVDSASDSRQRAPRGHKKTPPGAGPA